MSTELSQVEKGCDDLAPDDFNTLFGRKSRVGQWTEERKAEALAFASKADGGFLLAGFAFGDLLHIIFGQTGTRPSIATFGCVVLPPILLWVFFFVVLGRVIAYFGLPGWLTCGYKVRGWLPTDPDESLFVERPGGCPTRVRALRRWLKVRFGSSDDGHSTMCEWTEERKAKTLHFVMHVRFTLMVIGSIIGMSLGLAILLKCSNRQAAIFIWFWTPFAGCWAWLFAILAELLVYLGLPKWLTFGYKVGGWLPVEPDESLMVEGEDSWPLVVDDIKRWREARRNGRGGPDGEVSQAFRPLFGLAVLFAATMMLAFFMSVIMILGGASPE